MNSESPFRIPSMVLTVACIICGIAAASYLVPRFIPLHNTVEQTKVAASALQGNLSEFQTNEGAVRGVAASHQPLAASGRQLFPTSHSRATESVSATLLKAPNAIQQTDHKNGLTSTSVALVETTSIQRSASPWASEGHSVPQFYAPVTVHPVTVNIDNAGIIREISRVHERLDLLSAEAKSAAPAKATVRDADATAPAKATGTPATDGSSEYRIHDEQTKQNSPIQQTATDRPSIIASEFQPAPEPKPVPTRLPTTPPQLIPSNPRAEATFDIPTAPPPRTPTTIPVSDTAPIIDVTPPLVVVPESLPEIQGEMTPRPPVPEIPTLEPPAFEPPTFEPRAFEPPVLKPEAELPGSLPEIEFSTELFPIQEPTATLESTSNTEEPLLSFPASDFVEPMANIVPAIAVQQLEWPDFATLAEPNSPSAKRTTDPPFMNGRRERVPGPPQTVNEPTGGVQRVSHATQAADNHATPCDCKNCAATRQAKSPAYRIRAVTPSQTFNRIRSALSF